MPSIETKDQINLYYRDWGTGQPVVFLSSQALSGAMWEYQMVPFCERGLRCIAYDRRGHGHSDDPGRGFDFDTLADDLAGLLTHLDLHEVTLIGQSMGCTEIARYLSRHGASRIARVALIGTITPFLLKTQDNPEGTPEEMFDGLLKALLEDRPHFYSMENISNMYFGLGWQEVVSLEMAQWLTHLALETSPRANVACFRSAWHTDFRPDMHAFTVPTLIIHGERDQNSPLLCGERTAQAIPGSLLHIYEGAAHGLFLTHKGRLNEDLLAFING